MDADVTHEVVLFFFFSPLHLCKRMLLSWSTFSDSAAVMSADPHENKCKLCPVTEVLEERSLIRTHSLSACWKSVDHLLHQYLSPARSLLVCCPFSVSSSWLCVWDEISLSVVCVRVQTVNNLLVCPQILFLNKVKVLIFSLEKKSHRGYETVRNVDMLITVFTFCSSWLNREPWNCLSFFSICIKYTFVKWVQVLWRHQG